MGRHGTANVNHITTRQEKKGPVKRLHYASSYQGNGKAMGQTYIQPARATHLEEREIRHLHHKHMLT